MSNVQRRSDRLAALRERARRLPEHEGELGARIEAASPERLLERNRRTAACRFDAVNMATVYGERNDGCESVGCLAALATLDCPQEAATAHLRTARDCNLPERAISMLGAAARILGLDPATCDALVCGIGSDWLEDLAAVPNDAILKALDQAIAGGIDAAIRAGTISTGR